MPTVALGSDFLDAYARIPRAQQRKVREFTEKFKANPKSSAINYEKSTMSLRQEAWQRRKKCKRLPSETFGWNPAGNQSRPASWPAAGSEFCGPWGGKGDARHGLVGGQPVEGFEPRSRVTVTLTNSKADKPIHDGTNRMP